jgi:cytochrome c553
VPPVAPSHSSQHDASLKHVAGSNLTFTLAQVHDHFGPADWHPEDHGPMPAIVAYGRKPDVQACALCHYANGQGRSQNAALAGLPVAYFVQQMMDFKNGDRTSAAPKKENTKTMIAIAKAMTGEEIKSAAEYFGGIHYKPWVKVVETQTVPKTRVVKGLFLKLDGAQTEPIGNRIIEIPSNTEATQVLHDDHSGFTAYVPVGSIKKGKLLIADTRAGKTVKCGICHGSDLEGVGVIPPLAGRSPSYLARQIYDIQTGARNGTGSPLMITMQEAVANLTPVDIWAISAYIASLPAPAAANAHSDKMQ